MKIIVLLSVFAVVLTTAFMPLSKDQVDKHIIQRARNLGLRSAVGRTTVDSNFMSELTAHAASLGYTGSDIPSQYAHLHAAAPTGHKHIMNLMDYTGDDEDDDDHCTKVPVPALGAGFDFNSLKTGSYPASISTQILAPAFLVGPIGPPSDITLYWNKETQFWAFDYGETQIVKPTRSVVVSKPPTTCWEVPAYTTTSEVEGWMRARTDPISNHLTGNKKALFNGFGHDVGSGPSGLALSVLNKYDCRVKPLIAGFAQNVCAAPGFQIDVKGFVFYNGTRHNWDAAADSLLSIPAICNTTGVLDYYATRVPRVIPSILSGLSC